MIETVLAALVGLTLAAAIYLILSRALIRVLLGIVLLGNGINLLIFESLDAGCHLIENDLPAMLLVRFNNFVGDLCRFLEGDDDRAGLLREGRQSE